MTLADDLSVPFKHEGQDLIDEITSNLGKANGETEAIDNFTRHILNMVLSLGSGRASPR